MRVKVRCLHQYGWLWALDVDWGITAHGPFPSRDHAVNDAIRHGATKIVSKFHDKTIGDTSC